MRLRVSFLLVVLFFLPFLSCQKIGEDVNPWDIPEEELPSIKSDIRIAVLGDSISTFAGFLASDTQGYQGAAYKSYYPSGDVRKINDTWWYKLCQLLGADINNLCNCSWSGSRVTGNSNSETDASAGCSNRRIADLSVKGFTPDLVICYISCNDWANSVPIGDWSSSDPVPEDGNVSSLREAYALMIHKIRQQYPSSMVVCLTNLDDSKRDKTPGWPSNNTVGVTVEEWNQNIKEISSAFDCITIDLQTCGINYENVSKYTVDGGLHPNSAGMTLIAKKIASDLSPLLEKQ